MKIILYSLPNCGICHMIKTKLITKNIIFEERNFGEIADTIDSDHAPALMIDEEKEKPIILNNPLKIVDWINQYGA